MNSKRSRGLDCIVVGHNDVDFAMVEQALAKTKNHSAAYVDLMANSVPYRGRRVTYMSLLNEVLTDVTDKPHDLHECELPHLGTAYLASYLRRRGHETEIINFFNKDKGKLADLLENAAPKAVAITTTLYVEHSPITEIVQFIRAHNPETCIIVGGPHVFNICSTQAEPTQNFLFQAIGADVYVFDSQGELALSRVIEQLGEDGDLSRIPNLVYTTDGRTFTRTERKIEENDMNANVVDWKLFDADFYTPTVQTRTARSCAFSCSFCRYPVNAGPLKLTGLEVLEGELRYLKSRGVKNVVFIDDTFNVPLPRFKEICRMMIRNQLDLNWYSFFRASNSDDEAIDLMVESGCKGVFLGLESGDPTILKYMNKHADPSKYAYAIKRFNEVGITSFASIIVGFPGETEQTFQNTMEFLTDAPPTFYRGEMYYHYNNVPIQDRAGELGIQGAGYSWKHKTMDWRRATELLEVMYRNLQGPHVLPGYMFDFWALPYLAGKGFDVRQVKGFTKAAQSLLVRGLSEASPESSHEEAALRAVFQPA